LTLGQIQVMFEHAQKREDERIKIQAIMHGADIKEDEDEEGVFGDERDMASPKKKKSFFKFGDPEDYKKISRDKQLDLTKKMMNYHKSWVNKPRRDGKTGPLA